VIRSSLAGIDMRFWN